MAYTDIDKSDDYFNTVLYTGNGGTNNITGVNFQPDLVWVKDRTLGFDHVLQDSVRGTTKIINSNQTYVEFTNTGSITSFNSDGWTTGSYVATNQNTIPFVAWNWLAANGTASNTDGSITSTVSANTTSGFSIVSYTGTGSVSTIGHGLGVAPTMIIVKARNYSNQAWPVDCRQGNSGAGGIMYLNETGTLGGYGDTSPFPTTAPTSTVFSVGTPENTNANTYNYIAYCFAEKKGFSKFSSYTGNGSSNGPFIYTGFKPAWVMVRETGNVNSWRILDNKRSPINVMTKVLYANLSNTEGSSGHNTDFLSNGFKIRDSDTSMNRSGGEFIYMCFAENPFVTSTGIAGTAR